MAASNGRARILVVDDDAIIRSLLRRLLEMAHASFNVTEAVDATSARRLVEAGRFDCIVLDHLLPDVPGLDFLRWFRSRDATTPVIVFTGMGDEALATNMMKAGATDYLSKVGFNKDRFLQTIHEALNGAPPSSRARRLGTDAYR